MDAGAALSRVFPLAYLAASTALPPGIHDSGFRSLDGDPIVLLSLVPFAQKQGARLGTYRIGRWPQERGGGSAGARHQRDEREAGDQQRRRLDPRRARRPAQIGAIEDLLQDLRMYLDAGNALAERRRLIVEEAKPRDADQHHLVRVEAVLELPVLDQVRVAGEEPDVERVVEGDVAAGCERQRGHEQESAQRGQRTPLSHGGQAPHREEP